MNHPLATALPGQFNGRLYLIALLCGLWALTPGCRIPCLRQALPGPAMPEFYNWNNGGSLPNPKAAANPAYTKQDSDSTHIAAYSNGSTVDAASYAADVDVRFEEESGSTGNRETGNQDAEESSRSALDRLNLVRLFRPSTEKSQPDGGPEKASSNGSSSDSAAVDSGFDFPTPFASTSTTDPEEGAAKLNSVSSDINTGIGPLENSAQLPKEIFFNDPYLLGLITQALTGNQELRILSEEIQIARNEAYARSGEYLPFVTLGGGAGFEKPGRYTREGAVEEQLEVVPGRDFPDPLPDFLVATNVTWELDIWRKLRNAQSAAAMRFLGTQEGRNYVVTRLVAEVAENYYSLLALDNRLLTLEKTIAIQEQSLEIAKAKKEAARGTELAVQRFQAEVRKNQSERTLIAQEIVEAENRINFLVGRYPQQVERASVDFINLNLDALSAGVPSQLLQNRADIRQAERNVAAAGLDVRVARARFYPSLTLTSGLGWNAFSTGYLLQTPESFIYGLAAELVGPLINKRAIKADYCSANAAQLQSIYEYQRTVLTAHIEVVNYITKIDNYRESIEVKKQQLQALEASVDSATQLFQNARAEYVEVLLAQREMMEARMLLIETKQEQLSAVVNAYQALGGGGF